MRVVGIIPARYASSRLPGKPLLSIAGKPMIQHVYERASQAKSLDWLLVATDDPRVKEVVEGFGGFARLTSPSHPSGTDRAAEVASDLSCDLVVNVQGDEPLIPPALIDEAVLPLLHEATLPMGTVCRRIVEPAEALDPNVTKVVFDLQGFALYFSRAPIPYVREGVEGLGLPFYKHIGLYVYRRETLLKLAKLKPTPLEEAERLEQLRALEHGVRIRVVETRHDSFGVDTPEDLEKVCQLMAEGAGFRDRGSGGL
ncbi:MAG: 3-deoxy-manno-octulosonate cytidylyltransferase [candidate division NC10 bacterium]|nr:3-deoxy-manno-octulosonate cytidylyltransferase [candidate division NC10 bacterium]